MIYIIVISLEPFIPYMVSIAGFTSKGRGDIVETDIFFTEEGGTFNYNY